MIPHVRRGGDLLDPMLAYIGPGGALSAIGAFVALVAALLLAVVGFLWYPLKQLLRALRRRRDAETGGGADEGAEA